MNLRAFFLLPVKECWLQFMKGCLIHFPLCCRTVWNEFYWALKCCRFTSSIINSPSKDKSEEFISARHHQVAAITVLAHNCQHDWAFFLSFLTSHVLCCHFIRVHKVLQLFLPHIKHVAVLQIIGTSSNWDRKSINIEMAIETTAARRHHSLALVGDVNDFRKGFSSWFERFDC